MSRILIAEDEPRISSFLSRGLSANGFTVTLVGDGASAVGHSLTGDFDLLILDIGLPDEDGFSVLRRIREGHASLPVIILTARDSVIDTVTGLQSGADDYMSKPFQFEELLARVRLRLRGDRTPEVTVLRNGDLSLDLRTRRASVGGRSVDLTAREFVLAETFLRSPGQVLSREQLLSHVWGYDFDPGSNIVDVYVRYLRRKLGVARIETLRGMGYRLVDARTEPPTALKHENVDVAQDARTRWLSRSQLGSGKESEHKCIAAR
ncbi:MAG: response regulator transcription factor [Nocardioidaceae bacterium]|nr:response regulator transcription factor [Nocardioidaceae bacterium]